MHFPTTRDLPAALTLRLTRAQLLGLLGSGALDGVDMEGDTSVITRLLALTDAPDPLFHLVEP
ncbi:alkyl sulfatase C-terminal domain-containing protein [Mumia zhuanghuii]|uniref:alkyl sulfatase C-terminal domain-containing protein n=1 Tax=Mumia zhuanghuii TaxID=2585211 RepID=UPI001891789D|nr:alkyl sulfatase C-terminal domain-containing protein [Mumia zhuanghuii]